jgi:hypothetical protein
VATLVNIAALDRDEEGILGLPSILAASVGRTIEDIYRSSDKGNLEDVQLLQVRALSHVVRRWCPLGTNNVVLVLM